MNGRPGVRRTAGRGSRAPLKRPQARMWVRHRASRGSPVLSYHTLQARGPAPLLQGHRHQSEPRADLAGLVSGPRQGPSSYASSATTSPARTHGRPSGQPPRKGNQSCWSPQTLSVRLGERQRPEEEAQARPQGEVAGGSESRLDV